MIVINKAYLKLFYETKTSYLYKVAGGIYLSFKKPDLRYNGVELFYIPFDFKSYQTACDNKLNVLISKGILEIVEV